MNGNAVALCRQSKDESDAALRTILMRPRETAAVLVASREAVVNTIPLTVLLCRDGRESNMPGMRMQKALMAMRAIMHVNPEGAKRLLAMGGPQSYAEVLRVISRFERANVTQHKPYWNPNNQARLRRHAAQER